MTVEPRQLFELRDSRGDVEPPALHAKRLRRLAATFAERARTNRKDRRDLYRCAAAARELAAEVAATSTTADVRESVQID